MEKTKKPRAFRFNFIDALLLLIILAAVGVLAYIFISADVDIVSSGSGTVGIVYEVEVRQAREEFKGLINIGDKVVDSVTLYDIGEVVNVTYADAQYTGVNKAEGVLVFSPYPEHINIIMTVKATAKMNEGLYMLGGYEMQVGKRVSFRVPGYTAEGFCTVIKEVNENE